MAIKKPWSISYLQRMTPRVSLPSALRLRRMVLREGGCRPPRRGLVRVRVKRPFSGIVWLREPGTDYSTFSEVVMKEIYHGVVQVAAPCEYVLDLGANIGLTSLYLASEFPRCRIMSVEPSAENQHVLSRNLAPLAASGRSQICAGAVWREDTELDLKPPRNETEYDAIQVTATDDESTAEHRVKGYTVGSLMRMASFPRIDILKVDIEGAETELFRGPTEWLSKVNAITIEFHGDSRTASGFDSVIGAAGFRIEDDRSPNTVLAYRPNGQRVC